MSAEELVSVPEQRVLDLLGSGDIELCGLLPYASNATFLVRVGGEDGAFAVYKPRRGETPLWDFPRGTLCLREYAAWVVDRALGWRLVPPTVLREGPAGFGAVQFFVEEAPEGTDLRRVLDSHPEDLRRMALFDLVVNNADRKAGHCLLDLDGRLWGVDHGITFHAEPKLRTVIWAFEGEPVPESLLSDLEAFGSDTGAAEALERLLDAEEVEALHHRIAKLLRTPRFPSPGPGRHVPWPPY